MKVGHTSKLRLCLLGTIAAVAFSATAPFASADTLTIDTAQSSLTFTLYLLTDPNDPNSIFATALGQGDLPDGTVPTGDGTRIPGYSNGLSAQLSGTVDVTPGGFSINAGTNNINLLDSGSWQPGVGATPDPANLGIYLLFTLANPNDSVITAAVQNLILDVNTSGNVPLGGGGAFNDPLGTFTLVSGNVQGVASTPIGGGPIVSPLPLTSVLSAMAGTYNNGQLILPLASSIVLDISEAVGADLGLRIDISGQLVTLVPEPSSMALLGMGAVGLVALGYRRLRRK